MLKQLLNKDKVCAMIRKCYESDPVFINNYHEIAGEPINKCIYHSVKTLKSVDVYVIYKDNNLVGYFGDNNHCLTGFFILPEFRKDKQEVWNLIQTHFNGNFLVGILSKNKPAIRFFKDNGCKFVDFHTTIDGPGEIYMMENK